MTTEQQPQHARTEQSSAGAPALRRRRPPAESQVATLPEDAPDHRAGAQRRALPGHHAAAHAGPGEVARRRAGGARAASGRSACSCRASPRSRTRAPTTCTGSARSRSVLRYITAPDGSHHIVCQGLQRFRVLQFLRAIRSWPRASSSSRSPRSRTPRWRRACSTSSSGARDPAAAAAGAAGAGQRRAVA